MTLDQLSDLKLDIHRAYARLWSKVPFYQIRVKGICQETPIARSTFYSHYDNIEDLRQEVENRLLTALIDLNQSHFEKPIHQPQDLTFVAVTLDLIKQEEPFFRAFLIDQYNPSFVYKWQAAMMDHLRLLFPPGQEELDLKLKVFSAAAITALSQVLKAPEQEIKLEELQNLIFKVLF